MVALPTAGSWMVIPVVLNPYSLLPIALAARDGHVDGFEVQQLVAAGLTLLRRSAPLVRSLSGKRAAILLPTSPEFLVAIGACEGRGALLINPLLAPPEISHQLADARVGAVFTSTTLAAKLPERVPRILLDDAVRSARVLVDGADRDIDLGSHRGLSIEGDVDVDGSDEEAAIVYTSAMAGHPLGAVLSHRSLLASARSTAAAIRYTADDRVLALLPFSHPFGLTVTACAPLLRGASVLTMSRFDPVRAADLVATGQISVIVGVPAVFHILLRAMRRQARPSGVGALRVCVCGGEPLSLELQERWHAATGVELRQGYGVAEAGPGCLFNTLDRPNARGTAGTPLPDVEIELRAPVRYDDDGLPLPDDPPHSVSGNSGEICVRGKNVFAGYVSGGAAGLPVHDGWLHTGDLGKRGSDGAITVVGTTKPMFTRHGFDIYPREIERVVAEMPGVESAAVRETPANGNRADGTIEAAVHGSVSESEVREWCAAQLSVYKRPTVITIR